MEIIVKHFVNNPWLYCLIFGIGNFIVRQLKKN